MIWTSFSIWLEEIETFFSMTQRIKLLFFWIWFTELNRFLRFDSKNWIWFTELNPFLKYDSKNWIWLKGLTFFFWNMTQRIDCFSENFDSKNWTLKENIAQRIELFFLNMTPRIEPVFLSMTLRTEPFFLIKVTQRIESSPHDSKNWKFFFWKTENWTLFF